MGLYEGAEQKTRPRILFIEVDMKKGYVQVYTGNGKGKTTAAFGLAIRAAGAGLRVFIGQFAKGQDYSELHSFARFADQITICQYGRKCFIYEQPESNDIYLAKDGLSEIRKAVVSGDYKLVILDEANIAVYFGLFSADDLIEIIDIKPKDVELVITGRYANSQILARADLVTEMREIKHYYQQGVMARVGIEN